MGRTLFRRAVLLPLLTLLAACNPQSKLGIGVLEDEVPLDGAERIFSGLSFLDGKLLVSKAINRDLYGAMGSDYCFDNADSKYGCEKANSSGKPVFLRSIQFSLLNRSSMFGLSATQDLEVVFLAATVTSGIPVLNPDTGDFVFTKKEKYRWDGAQMVQLTAGSVDSSCVPGVNGAIGFADRPGAALTGLHVFEEGVDNSTSLSGLFAAKVDFKYYSISDGGDGELIASDDEGSASVTGLSNTSPLAAAPFTIGPELSTMESYSSVGGDLPRVITGFCLRTAKKSPQNIPNPLIRVGIFGVRGVFFKARFR